MDTLNFELKDSQEQHPVITIYSIKTADIIMIALAVVTSDVADMAPRSVATRFADIKIWIVKLIYIHFIIIVQVF